MVVATMKRVPPRFGKSSRVGIHMYDYGILYGDIMFKYVYEHINIPEGWIMRQACDSLHEPACLDALDHGD
jgi:hypothetical protein